MRQRHYLAPPDAMRAVVQQYESGEPIPDEVRLRLGALGARPTDRPLAGARRVVLPGGIRVWEAPRLYSVPWWYRAIQWLDEAPMGTLLAIALLLAIAAAIVARLAQ